MGFLGLALEANHQPSGSLGVLASDRAARPDQQGEGGRDCGARQRLSGRRVQRQGAARARDENAARRGFL